MFCICSMSHSESKELLLVTFDPGCVRDTHAGGKQTCLCRSSDTLCECGCTCKNIHFLYFVTCCSLHHPLPLAKKRDKIKHISYLARSFCPHTQWGIHSCGCSTCWRTLLRLHTHCCCKSLPLPDNLKVSKQMCGFVEFKKLTLKYLWQFQEKTESRNQKEIPSKENFTDVHFTVYCKPLQAPKVWTWVMILK